MPGTEMEKFSLRSYAEQLNTQNGVNQEIIQATYEGLQPQIETLFNSGFFIWLTEDDLSGHQATYASTSRASFTMTRMILGGSTQHTTISGKYSVFGNALDATLYQEINSPYVTSRVFINNKLVAERSNPYSYVDIQTQLFVKNLAKGRGDDPHYLDLTLQDDRNPYPFILMALHDLKSADADLNMSAGMFEKMSKRYTCIRTSDYRLEF